MKIKLLVLPFLTLACLYGTIAQAQTQTWTLTSGLVTEILLYNPDVGKGKDFTLVKIDGLHTDPAVDVDGCLKTDWFTIGTTSRYNANDNLYDAIITAKRDGVPIKVSLSGCSNKYPIIRSISF